MIRVLMRVACATVVSLMPISSARSELQPLRVSDDRRHFVTADGRPFFYLADTAWTMIPRLSLEEVDEYLADRKAKGFNVIQVVLVPWGVRAGGTRSGVKPYLDDDLARPNPAYFDHVEAVLDRIEAAGFYPAVVPFWLAGLPAPGPGETDRYRAYARYLGERFGRRQMVWLLGADRAADPFVEVIRAFAHELERSSGRDDLLITHHPQGGQSSSRWFHDEPWLDFNMAQSGHNLDLPHYQLIDRDYARQPTKPVLDGEPAYEHLANNLVQVGPGVRLVTAYDVRRQAYQNVFAGAAGLAYGACEVYEFYREGDGKARWTVGMPWRDAMQLPGATQVTFVAELVRSMPPPRGVPDQKLIASDNPGEPGRHLKAMRAADGRWALVYAPRGEPFALDTTRLTLAKPAVYWFNPRDGTRQGPLPVPTQRIARFRPPTTGDEQDWVLILREAGAEPGPPNR
jgi:hypothetical protein